MEEHVGALWHRLITRMAQNHFPDAAVTLEQIGHTVGILFRALGGDGGLQVEAAHATEHGARRSLLHRIAGDAKKVELAWRDDRSLRLPAVIDLFPTTQLNRDLYLWLAALAVGDHQAEEPWISKNQRLTLQTLQDFPGIRPRYARLVAAHLAQRIVPDYRLKAESMQEAAIRQALQHPGSIAKLPAAMRPPQPVPLWLHPFPPITLPSSSAEDSDEGDSRGSGAIKDLQEEPGKRAERAEKPETKDRGLITIRMENIFTWGNFLNLDRGSEENDDLESAADAAKDMEVMSVSPDAKASAGKLRFDLDLPAAAEDDLVLNEGILLPEWDYKKRRLLPDLCRILPMLAAKAEPVPPARLAAQNRQKTARTVSATGAGPQLAPGTAGRQ